MCECVQTAQLNGEERGQLLRMFAAKPPGGLAEPDIAFLKRLPIFPGAHVCVNACVEKALLDSHHAAVQLKLQLSKQ